jgi:DNA helicase-2/ATP-dependent DNA helicase PcrA
MLQQLWEKFKQNDNQKIFSKAKVKQLDEFVELIKKIQSKSQKLSLKELIEYIIKASGYKNYLLDGSEEGETRFENVMELLSVAERYQDLKPNEAIERFLEEVSLATSEENPANDNNLVTLMTLHSAKGLEFDNVFLAGFEEGLLPHSRALENPFEMEEERRLCYVGVTRAGVNLWITYARTRHLFGQTLFGKASRFMSDITEKLIKKEAAPTEYLSYNDYPETDSRFYEEKSIFL